METGVEIGRAEAVVVAALVDAFLGTFAEYLAFVDILALNFAIVSQAVSRVAFAVISSIRGDAFVMTSVIVARTA